MKVLLIDDSKTVRVSIAGSLRLRSFEVRTAESITGGLDEAREWEPDVVVLDVMMLRSDGGSGGGLHLLRFLRRELPRIPVIMLSGEAGGRSRRAALWSGAAGYVTKTSESEVTTRALVEAFEACVQSRRDPRQT